MAGNLAHVSFPNKAEDLPCVPRSPRDEPQNIPFSRPHVKVKQQFHGRPW